jgi:hypothetical protein
MPHVQWCHTSVIAFLPGKSSQDAPAPMTRHMQIAARLLDLS